MLQFALHCQHQRNETVGMSEVVHPHQYYHCGLLAGEGDGEGGNNQDNVNYSHSRKRGRGRIVDREGDDVLTCVVLSPGSSTSSPSSSTHPGSPTPSGGTSIVSIRDFEQVQSRGLPNSSTCLTTFTQHLQIDEDNDSGEQKIF